MYTQYMQLYTLHNQIVNCAVAKKIHKKHEHNIFILLKGIHLNKNHFTRSKFSQIYCMQSVGVELARYAHFVLICANLKITQKTLKSKPNVCLSITNVHIR